MHAEVLDSASKDWILERAMGIEPTSEAWEASILPLYDARSLLERIDYTRLSDCSHSLAVFHIFNSLPENAARTCSSGISPAYLAVITAELCPLCWRGTAGFIPESSQLRSQP